MPYVMEDVSFDTKKEFCEELDKMGGQVVQVMEVFNEAPWREDPKGKGARVLMEYPDLDYS